MSKLTQRCIEVYAYGEGLSVPILMGVLHVTPSRGKEIFAFDYDPNGPFLDNNKTYASPP